MGILHIPDGLLLAIGGELSIKDLYHFLSTCRRLRPLFTPRLHELGVQDVHGLTALQWAAGRGHASLAELAISRGAGIDERRKRRSGRRRTPLHSAARHNHPAVIRALIKHGANIAAKDSDLQTPLHLAVKSGKEEATRALLELGADMTCVGAFMETPAYLAVESGSVGCMKAFVDAGIDFSYRPTGSGGMTILHKAAYCRSEMMEYLLGQEGAKMAINAQDSRGYTPLHSAMDPVSGAQEVRLLLRHGADMEVKDRYGDTPAHRAVHLNNIECLKPLLEAGFDTNTRAKIRGISGRTILHEAVLCSDVMLSYLLGQEVGRSIINARDSLGSTPLHLAVDCGVEVDRQYPWFLERRIGVRTKWEEKVRLLVRHGADPEMKDIYGNTPAHIAAYRGDVDCMKSLIRVGFDFNIRGLCKRTILHAAIFGGQRMTEYLLKQEGAEMVINARDSEGLTPLHLALQLGSEKEKIVRLLLHYGAGTEGRGGHGGRRTVRCGAHRGEHLARRSLERGPHASGGTWRGIVR